MEPGEDEHAAGREGREAARGPRTLWVDGTAGVAGDMLLAALVDAGADLGAVRAAVEAVVPGAVRLTTRSVVRAHLRALKADVEVLVDDPPHRTWAVVRDLVGGAAGLPEAVRDRSLAVFERLAVAEGRVHGVPADDVHFHEVGALDAVADVVGCCAALHDLGVDDVVVSPVALGSGSVRAQHGTMAVPVPAVLELSRGWDVLAGGDGELATPTGMALVTAAGARGGALPPLRVDAVGTGAGTRDPAGRANVVRVVLGSPTPGDRSARGSSGAERRLEEVEVLEATVDDLDPRVWPDVVAGLLARGALDAWLSPVLMKKGRPGHTLHVLGRPGAAEELSDAVLALTTTLGVRRTTAVRDVLDRSWVVVPTSAGDVRLKVGHRDGVVRRVTPELEDVLAAATRTGVPLVDLLDEARAAGRAAGVVVGATWTAPGPPAEEPTARGGPGR